MSAKGHWAEFAGTVIAIDDIDLVHTIRNENISAFERPIGRYECKSLRVAQHVPPEQR